MSQTPLSATHMRQRDHMKSMQSRNANFVSAHTATIGIRYKNKTTNQ